MLNFYCFPADNFLNYILPCAKRNINLPGCFITFYLFMVEKINIFKFCSKCYDFRIQRMKYHIWNGKQYGLDLSKQRHCQNWLNVLQRMMESSNQLILMCSLPLIVLSVLHLKCLLFYLIGNILITV